MNVTTQVFRINGSNFEEIIRTAAGIIRRGGTVAFPTETVYGLGADALNPEAVQNIFKAKGRPLDNPLIVHIAYIEQLHDIVKDIPKGARDLIDTFWPGPLTLIFKRKDIVPDVTTCGLDTVAVRMPDNPVALALIKEAGTPIAAPSANLSGRPSPANAEHVISDLDGRIDCIIDGGPADIGVESTVLDVTSRIPVVLRPGGIGIEDIRNIISEVVIGYGDVLAAKGEVVRSPGMKYTHYSPRTMLILVEGDTDGVADKISELVSIYHEKDMRVGLLAAEDTAVHVAADKMYSLGKKTDPLEAARRLFSGLRYLDSEDVDVIIADGSMGIAGIGAAVLNRLQKAADELIEVE